MRSLLSVRIWAYGIGVCCICFNLSCSTAINADELLLKGVEAHGGIQKWENIKEITYLKTTILYDSLGAVEKKVVQRHYNRFIPSFYAEMQWKEDAIPKKVVLDQNVIQIYYNDSIVNDAVLAKKYYKNIVAANYVFWQPYKLLHDDVQLEYLGKEKLNNEEVDVIQANYKNEDGSSGNTWWYYFNTKTNRLVANMVHHPPTYSLIMNTAYETKTGLYLNATRKSYRVDSLKNIQFLRAAYDYKIMELKE